MKPKVRIYECSSWPPSEYQDVNLVKEETPMDLSVKRQSSEHSINSFHIHHDDSQHISPDLIFSGIARGYPVYNPKYGEASPNLLPYLLSHNDYETSSLGPRLALRHEKLNAVHKKERSPEATSLAHFPYYNGIQLQDCNYALKHYLYSKRAQADCGNPTGSPRRHSPSSSVGSNTYSETKRLLQTNLASLNYTMINARRSQTPINRNHFQTNLVKASSESALNRCSDKEHRTFWPHKRWKSESDIIFALKPSNWTLSWSGERRERANASPMYEDRQGECKPEPVRSNGGYGEHRQSDDEDMASEDLEPENALDLSVSNTMTLASKEHNEVDQEYILRHIQTLISDASADHKRMIDPTGSVHPWEIYKQYYYYLMNQPSRAAFAASVAQVYNKLMSSPTNPMMRPTTNDFPGSKYKPDGPLEGYNGHAELRSADTTNSNDYSPEKKRISRPLTGRHVRHGTGASPSTLLSLRHMIQERQRMKELGLTTQSKQKPRKNQKRK